MKKDNTKDPEIEINAKIKGSDEWKQWSGKDWGKNSGTSHGTAGALYFVGFIGAVIYWMQSAHNFGAVVTGFLKASVWPAYIVYKLLESFYGIAR